MDENYFLGQGKFTQRGKIVARALENALTITERKTSLGKISLWMQENLIHNSPKKMEEFRKRNASQIISSQRFNGCSDYGIVFAVLSREAGIPTRYIETIEESNLKSKNKFVDGHVFFDVFVNGEWKIYEPKEGFKPDYILGKSRYIPIAKGLDFSNLLFNDKNISLDSLDKLRKARDNFKI